MTHSDYRPDPDWLGYVLLVLLLSLLAVTTWAAASLQRQAHATHPDCRCQTRCE